MTLIGVRFERFENRDLGFCWFLVSDVDKKC